MKCGGINHIESEAIRWGDDMGKARNVFYGKVLIDTTDYIGVLPIVDFAAARAARHLEFKESCYVSCG